MKIQFHSKLNGAIFVPLLLLLTIEPTLSRNGAEWIAAALYLTNDEVRLITETAGASAHFIGKVEGRSMTGTITTPHNGQAINRIIGEVQAIDQTLSQLSLKLDSGAIVIVKLSPQTAFLRVPPGETNLQKAVKISLEVVGIGDRVFANGQLAADRTSIPAQQVIVMTKADVAAQQERERADWRGRSIVGTIIVLNPATKEIQILRPETDGEKPVTLSLNDGVRLRRYAPDSIKFGDAQPSSFDALRVGDQLRVRGEMSADGLRFTPEEIVFGTFRTFGGTITAINAVAKEITLQDLQTQQAITVVMNPDSLLRRLPPDLVAQLAQRLRKPKPAAKEPDWQALIERLSVLALTDLQPGEQVIVSSTSGAQPNRVTAIGCFAGVERLLKEWQKQQGAQGGNANMSLGLPDGALGGLGRP